MILDVGPVVRRFQVVNDTPLNGALVLHAQVDPVVEQDVGRRVENALVRGIGVLNDLLDLVNSLGRWIEEQRGRELLGPDVGGFYK